MTQRELAENDRDKIVYDKAEYLLNYPMFEIDFVQDAQYVNTNCMIVIPIYRTAFSYYEFVSIQKCIGVLGKDYNICIVCPNTEEFRIRVFDRMFQYSFNYLFANPDYFTQVSSYSVLMENWKFYKVFEEYKYILIYQLDVFVFEDNLQYFLDLDYDYVAAPWNSRYGLLFNNKITTEMVGCGGCSLRRVSKFIEAAKALVIDDITAWELQSEDQIWCLNKQFTDILNICPVDVGAKFCFDLDPQYWYEKYKKLPMFIHKSWVTPESDVNWWEQFIGINVMKI